MVLQITTSGVGKLFHLGNVVEGGDTLASVLLPLTDMVKLEGVVYQNHPFLRHADYLAALFLPPLLI